MSADAESVKAIKATIKLRSQFTVIPMIMVIPVAVKIFYPIYFKMELTSCYEYLGIRFGKEIRILGAVLYVIQVRIQSLLNLHLLVWR